MINYHKEEKSMWKIGNVKINNRIVFAPMAGISNEVFRSLNDWLA